MRRFVGHFQHQPFAPRVSLRFTGLVSDHGSVAGRQVLADHVWASEVVDKAADASPADDAVESVIDL
jgi:hypothetical protein